MSTSSALASAKRRRANQNTLAQDNKGQPIQKQEPEPPQKFTPVQLLQYHELRISKMEQFLENIQISNESGDDVSSDNTNNLNTTNTINFETLNNNNKNIEELSNTLDNRVNLMKNELETNINDLSAKTQENLEKIMSELNTKINTVAGELKELETFKNMLIKNQSDIIDNNKIINDLSAKVNNIETVGKNEVNIEQFYNDLNNNSDELLEKLLSSSMNTLNIDSENLNDDNVINLEEEQKENTENTEEEGENVEETNTQEKTTTQEETTNIEESSREKELVSEVIGDIIEETVKELGENNLQEKQEVQEEIKSKKKKNDKKGQTVTSGI